MGMIWGTVGCLVLAIILLWIITGNLEQSRLWIRKFLMGVCWTIIGIVSLTLLFIVGNALLKHAFAYLRWLWSYCVDTVRQDGYVLLPAVFFGLGVPIFIMFLIVDVLRRLIGRFIKR